ncbi:MAG: GDSL family lipase [Phycisphaerae bacterium]|nr:GDSL family lipase [Phycisphaerae bacterium]
MTDIPLTAAYVHGAVSIETRDGGLRPWRLPHARRRLFPPDGEVVARAQHPAGVRLRLRTDSPRVRLRVDRSETPDEEVQTFDLVIGDALRATAALAPGESEVVFDDLPGEPIRAARPITVDIYLPVFGALTLCGLSVADGAACAPAEDARPRWIAYGSSITQCRAAHSPARAWPALAARLRGLNLTCMGFGGNCHMETMVAMTIRDLPADVITLKLGVNMHGGSYAPRTFAAQAIGFVRTVRQGHPHTPIAVISPIANVAMEHTPGATGMDLAMMREQLADAVSRLADCGDDNVHYVDGRELFGEDLCADYLPDAVHPTGDGYEIIGRNAAEKLLPALGF